MLHWQNRLTRPQSNSCVSHSRKMHLRPRTEEEIWKDFHLSTMEISPQSFSSSKEPWGLISTSPGFFQILRAVTNRVLPKSSWVDMWLHCPITSQGSLHLQISTADPKSRVWRETSTSQQYRIQCCMHAVNTTVWLGYSALPQYLKKPWKPFVSSAPLGHFSITESPMIWGKDSFSVLDCKNYYKSSPSVFQGLFAVWLCRPWYQELASISSPYEWFYFTHKLGQKYLYSNFDSRVLQVPFSLRTLPTHHKNKMKDQGPPGSDPSQQHPSCSLRHEAVMINSFIPIQLPAVAREAWVNQNRGLPEPIPHCQPTQQWLKERPIYFGVVYCTAKAN